MKFPRKFQDFVKNFWMPRKNLGSLRLQGNNSLTWIILDYVSGTSKKSSKIPKKTLKSIATTIKAEFEGVGKNSWIPFFKETHPYKNAEKSIMENLKKKTKNAFTSELIQTFINISGTYNPHAYFRTKPCVHITSGSFQTARNQG